MSEMVERVAANMYGKGWNDPELGKRPGEKMKNVWRRYARLAIEGMREPTDADFGGQYGTEPRRLFSAMIDAALSEKP